MKINKKIMAQSRHGKNHKKKAKARKKRIEQEKYRVEKAKKEFINMLIKQEKEKGMFNDNKSVDQMIDPASGPQI